MKTCLIVIDVQESFRHRLRCARLRRSALPLWTVGFKAALSACASSYSFRSDAATDSGQSHLNGDAQEEFQITQTPPRPLALGLQADLHRGVILEHLQRHASEHRLVVRTLILV